MKHTYRCTRMKGRGYKRCVHNVFFMDFESVVEARKYLDMFEWGKGSWIIENINDESDCWPSACEECEYTY